VSKDGKPTSAEIAESSKADPRYKALKASDSVLESDQAAEQLDGEDNDTAEMLQKAWECAENGDREGFESTIKGHYAE
jgi:hypothetical protein